MIASATNNDGVSKLEVVKDKKVWDDNNFYFYDKTVVFGNLPINREILYFQNRKMLKNIKEGYKIKGKTAGPGQTLNPLKYSITDADINLYNQARIKDKTVGYYAGGSVGAFTSRPCALNFNTITDYLYNSYGFAGYMRSTKTFLDFGGLILYLIITRFGFTLVGLLAAIQAAGEISEAFSNETAENTKNGTILCLRDFRLYYERYRVKGDFFFNRMKLLINKQKQTLEYDIFINTKKEDTFINSYQDISLCSSHPRSFGIVGTSAFSTPVRNEEKYKERAKNLITFSDQKYSKLQGTKMFDDKYLSKAMREEKESIHQMCLSDNQYDDTSEARKNMSINMDFGNYVTQRVNLLKIPTFYKGKKYYQSENNILKGSVFPALYYPIIAIGGNSSTSLKDMGTTGPASLGLRYNGGVSIDGGRILIPFSSNSNVKILERYPWLALFIREEPALEGNVYSFNRFLKRKFHAFPNFKTKLFGLGKNNEPV